MNSLRHAKSEKAFRFFTNHRQSNTAFGYEDLMAATGWSRSTVSTYHKKKWRDHLDGTPSQLRVKGFDGFTVEDFIRLQTQNDWDK